ncbi:type I phosphomannose isomerase catalytic subunit [Thermanaerovibrio velox]|uniref:type I phosphomannose isomerase catalytic subunit n=1 Tax=Thermanaerovibrio velox TaxID=108007 RepID=UPI00155A54AD|nr:type I phosphomannose isomerase catalytic subunit [Thermanaerovibrio velox]
MENLLFKLRPVLKERIWGGRRLSKLFGPAEGTLVGPVGECWALSGHPDGESLVDSGPFKGMGLYELFKLRPELFGDFSPSDRFPIMVKLIDANEDLSIQVHPDDRLAGELGEPDPGKAECWYVLDCPEGASIVLGHNGDTVGQVTEWILEGMWDRLVRRVPIRPGDFVFIPPGTVHSLCAGAFVAEVQISSDVTYRLYDYQRLGPDGSPRQLHVDKALRALQAPQRPLPKGPMKVHRGDGWEERVFLRGSPFSVSVVKSKRSISLSALESFLCVGVMSGEGRIRWDSQEISVSTGDHLVACRGTRFVLEGAVEVLLSSPEGKPAVVCP